MNDQTLKIYGHVISSPYRAKVLKAFDDNPRFPSELAKNAGIRQNHVSNVLRQLKMKGLVEIVNPEVKKGRYYRLTELGLEITKELK
jgi:DNA-binding HxlR family transcriptional regulator